AGQAARPWRRPCIPLRECGAWRRTCRKRYRSPGGVQTGERTGRTIPAGRSPWPADGKTSRCHDKAASCLCPVYSTDACSAPDMKRSYSPHIAIIQEAVDAIKTYRPETKAVFMADGLVQDAILMRLQVIGEHLSRIRRIDEERFSQIADPDWYKIIGLRHVISHGYETIDWDLIWLIIHDQLSTFETSLDRMNDKGR